MSNVEKLDESFINDSRFKRGMELFNSGNWYKSHDVFEEIWHETYGADRQVLQGILQVAVAQVHLENGNINGATILYGEALGRFKRSKLDHFRIDFEILCECVTNRLKYLQEGKNLTNCSIPVLIFV
tara:strand:+ start:126 stop:506 length:381 start_codon:yes stop_codon:yes gene_type:complete